MKYCPDCGKPLTQKVYMEGKAVKQCDCGFIDWDNWVNISAVTVAFNEQGELMLVRMKRTGKLTFPGGYRNLGESIEAAAKRECLEESGYQVDHLKLFNVYTLDRLRLVWIIFIGKVISGSFIDNDEVSEVCFIDLKHPPKDDEMRGSLSIQLLHEILNKD